jgi:hypothetical protein
MKSLLGNNKFKFILTGERFINNEFEPTVTGINIPSISIGTVEQPSLVRGINRPGDSLEFGDLSISFQVREDLHDWLTIYQWMIDIREVTEAKFKFIVCDADIILLTNKNNTLIDFKFENIYPTSLDDIQLSTEDNSSPITCSATFRYVSMKISENP